MSHFNKIFINVIIIKYSLTRGYNPEIKSFLFNTRAKDKKHTLQFYIKAIKSLTTECRFITHNTVKRNSSNFRNRRKLFQTRKFVFA